MIDIDAKRRLRRARLFFVAMFVLSLCAVVTTDGTQVFAWGVVLLNMLVWAGLALEYTAEIRLLGLRDKDAP